MNRKCRYCDKTFPETEQFFGHTPSGTFRWKCRECMRAHVKEHSTHNPQMVTARALARRERTEKVGAMSASQRSRVLSNQRRRQGSKCFYCKEKVVGTGELDHMTPIAKGGRDVAENLIFSCSRCNKEKHNKTVEEYRDWLVNCSRPVLFRV